MEKIKIKTKAIVKQISAKKMHHFEIREEIDPVTDKTIYIVIVLNANEPNCLPLNWSYEPFENQVSAIMPVGKTADDYYFFSYLDSYTNFTRINNFTWGPAPGFYAILEK
jgi:hypothetical protein